MGKIKRFTSEWINLQTFLSYSLRSVINIYLVLDLPKVFFFLQISDKFQSAMFTRLPYQFMKRRFTNTAMPVEISALSWYLIMVPILVRNLASSVKNYRETKRAILEPLPLIRFAAAGEEDDQLLKTLSRILFHPEQKDDFQLNE